MSRVSLMFFVVIGALQICFIEDDDYKCGSQA